MKHQTSPAATQFRSALRCLAAFIFVAAEYSPFALGHSNPPICQTDIGGIVPGGDIYIEQGCIRRLTDSCSANGIKDENNFEWYADAYLVPMSALAPGADLRAIAVGYGRVPITSDLYGYIVEPPKPVLGKVATSTSVGVGLVGPGWYTVVYDECQDGYYDASDDDAVYSFLVTIPNYPDVRSAFDSVRTQGPPAIAQQQTPTAEWTFHSGDETGPLMVGAPGGAGTTANAWASASTGTLPSVGPLVSPGPTLTQVNSGRAPSFNGLYVRPGSSASGAVSIVYTATSPVWVTGYEVLAEVLSGAGDGVGVAVSHRTGNEGNSVNLGPRAVFPPTPSGYFHINSPVGTLILLLPGDSLAVNVDSNQNTTGDAANFSFIVATKPAVTNGCGVWTKWTAPAPLPAARDGVSGVFDSARGRLVFFGGEGPGGHAEPFADTWEWDGAEWHLMATTGPQARGGHAMAYDSNRQRVVLFGGNHGSTLLDDTWEWDGVAWTNITPAGGIKPSPRYTHSMAFDPFVGKTVLFGGFDGAYRSDTWEWDGTKWTPSTGGPTGRVGGALAYDPSRGGLFLFGGYNGSANLNDCWDRIGSNWHPLTINPAPPARRYGVLAADVSAGTSTSGHLILFGGRGNSATLGDFWVLKQNGWESLPTGPAARTNLVAGYDSARSRFVVFGGSGDDYYNDTWMWDGSQWSSPSSGTPARTYGAAGFDSRAGTFIIHGGFTAANELVSDTWMWNGSIWSKLAAIGGPGKRYGHAMVFDPTADGGNGRVVMFGGYTQTSLLSEMWLWDGVSWSPRTLPGPSARYLQAMAYDSDRGKIVLYGGYDGINRPPPFGGNPGDTWEFTPGDYSSPTPGSWSSMGTTLDILPPRVHTAMAYDPIRHVTVLFGGNYGDTNFGDTHLWDGNSWTTPPISGPTPPARANHRMVFDAQRGTVVLFGGYAYEGVGTVALHDTWEWNGSAWSLLSTGDPPSARYGFFMDYDPARGRIIAHGGNRSGGTTQSDTWTFTAGPTATATGPQAISTSEQAAFSVAPIPDGTLAYRWRRNGANLIEQAGHIVGVTTPTLTISNALLTDAGSYDCVLTNACGETPSNPAALAVQNSCPADLNGDGIVEDADFVIFVFAYNTLDCADPAMPAGCPADFNHDGIVEDSDFVIFVAAYNELVCP